MFKAIIKKESPAKIVARQVADQILRSPNVETLEFRNFKKLLADKSMTMMKRITFETGEGLESLMYNNWKLVYDVINNPVDEVTGQSSYASKKIPPYLKERNEKGEFQKVADINRSLFLQSFYSEEDAKKIIRKYNSNNPEEEIAQFLDYEQLTTNAWFDRRTALRELFGDVMVLQEARRLLRNPDFIEQIGIEKPNLYNSLKDDVIRTGVLNDLAKGKSSAVKFSLAEEMKSRPKPDYITTNPYNIVGDNPMYSLKYDELFSSPSDFIKFSLSDIDEKAPEPSSKFKNFLDKIDLDEIDDREGWILKVLQQSDIQDDDIKVKKLHTLKTSDPEVDLTRELTYEVEQRFDKLIRSLSEPIGENEWIIQEYKEGYIDTMLKRSIDIPEEAVHTPYWNRMKIDENFRKEQLREKQIEQLVAIDNLISTINSSEFLDGDDLLFYRYLFFKDVLSNRYYPSGNNSVVKKSIKKSDYRTTIQPIQDYTDTDLLRDISSNYSDSKNIGIGAIYFIKKAAEKPIDFNDNFIQEVDEKNNLYKFNKGEDRDQINSLNTLASYSNKSGYSGSAWCTGSSRSMAASQLKQGDFYIIANKKNKIPVLSVRYSGNSIVEMAGTRDNQDLWSQDYNNIEFAINELPSDNKKIALKQLEAAKMLSKLSNEEINKFESEQTLEKLKLSIGINIHFGKEIYSKSKTASARLRKLINERQIRDGFSPLEMYKKGFNIDEDGKSNIVSEFDLDVLNKITEFTDNVIITVAPDDGSDEDFMENVIFPSEDLKLNELTKAEVLEINIPFFSTLEANKLTEAKMLSVKFERHHEEPYLSLPDKINYNIDLNFYEGDPNETYEMTIFDKEIDMSNNSLDLYFNDQETDSVILSGVNNSSGISITSVVTDFIDLPKKVKTLSTENIYGKSNPKVKVTGLEELETLNMEWSGFDDISFTKLKKIGNLEITLRDEYDKYLEDVIRGSNVFSIAENVEFTYEDHQGGDFNSKTLKSKPEETIKYSLAETANAAISPLLSGLNLTQQSVIARDIDKAIMNGKLSELAKNTEMDKLTAKLKKQTDPIEIKKVRQEMSDLFQADTVPFKVPRMSDSTDKAIATFIINKMAEGYNSFDFHVKKNANGPLTKQVLNALDANSEKIKQTAFRNSNLELTMNEIIEENKGIPRTEIFSEETAKNIGKGKKLDFAYLPPGDEDFEGLLYKLASGKGAIGEAQLEFFNENLITPYSEAMTTLMVARQKMYSDWKDVITKQHKGIIKLLSKQTDYEGYTYDQAVRVYLWDKAKYPIPGINNRDKFNLTDIVRTNPKLKDFANSVSLLSKQANGYIEPEKNWSFGSILGDMNNIISTVNRAKYLQDWQNRADKIFSKENLSKIEAVYGGEYVKALKNMLGRLKSGTNRNPGANSKLLNWLNKSTANVMFLNTRSAVLQLLSAVNFINTSDNNIAQAGLAFANVPQFWKDVKYLWNSPYLKDRRSGLMNDVAESEIAQLMDSQKGDDSINKYRRIVNWISTNGFIATRVFDAVAIATGGASFYRNRLNTYKKQGYTEEQAEKKTMADFYQTSEKSQQSADVSKISQNQASTTGRILLSFMNTPFQYSRIMKKAAIDIAKRRGSLANNVGKIVYYGAVQNIMFNALQNLLFATLWTDDDDEEEAKAKDSKQRTLRTVNGIADNILKGMGMNYVALSVVKNALIKWYDTTGTPEGVYAPVIELLNISPMVGIKFRQVLKGIKALEYNKEVNEEGDKVIPTKAIVEASASFISVGTNLSTDRVYQKIENIRGALDSQNEDWQRIALAFGYSKQNLGIKDKEEDAGSATRGSSLKSPGLSGGGLKSPGLK